MTTTNSQLSARLVDIFGPLTSAVPTAISGNLMVSPAGNILIGSTTDDTSNKLQVTGQFKSTSTATIGTGLANYVSIAGAATTNYPTITTAGTDANPSLYLSAKGTTGQVVIGATGGLSVSATAYVAGAATLNTTLTVNGVATFNGSGVIATAMNSLGQFVATTGSYGAGMRNDGTNFYLLQTASGSPTGSFNSYRPFSWTLATGAVQIDGTAAGTLISTTTRYSSSDTVNIGGSLCTQNGYRCRSGNAGSIGNIFNFYWTSSSTVQVWIDATNVGTMTLTSDARIKHSIKTNEDDLLDKVLGLRVVDYRIADVDIFKDDGKTKLGYIAGEVQSIFPQAVHGEKDALTAEGGIQPQTLDPIPLIAAHTGAVQRLHEKFEAMANRIAELEVQLNKMKV